MRWARHVARWGGKKCKKTLYGKCEMKRLLGRPERRWNNIKMNVREI
jgi:hypothetical protein